MKELHVYRVNGVCHGEKAYCYVTVSDEFVSNATEETF